MAQANDPSIGYLRKAARNIPPTLRNKISKQIIEHGDVYRGVTRKPSSLSPYKFAKAISDNLSHKSKTSRNKIYDTDFDLDDRQRKEAEASLFPVEKKESISGEEAIEIENKARGIFNDPEHKKQIVQKIIETSRNKAEAYEKLNKIKGRLLLNRRLTADTSGISFGSYADKRKSLREKGGDGSVRNVLEEDGKKIGRDSLGIGGVRYRNFAGGAEVEDNKLESKKPLLGHAFGGSGQRQSPHVAENLGSNASGVADGKLGRQIGLPRGVISH